MNEQVSLEDYVVKLIKQCNNFIQRGGHLYSEEGRTGGQAGLGVVCIVDIGEKVSDVVK